MKGTTYIISCIILLGMQACSAEAWKRSTHDAMEHKGRMDCQRSMQQDCGEIESYDTYKRKRDSVVN